MGKKSRRNKKTGNDAASAAAAAATTAASASAGSGTNRCFHGSTIDKFQSNSEYMKALMAYENMHSQVVVLLNNQNGSQTQHMRAVDIIRMKYDEDHINLIKDPEFCPFIFAFCTEQYLASNNFKNQLLHQMIQALLLLGSTCRFKNILSSDENEKYLRDSLTERGIIKILARETATYCNCMKEGKDIARIMDKLGRCYGCGNQFPKETLSFCNGCQFVRYHNRECQLNDWSNHKLLCKQMQRGVKSQTNKI
jgi:hypothetical protein